MKDIKAVIFDLDNTITDRDKAFYQFCDYLIDKYEPQFPLPCTKQELLDYMMEIDQSGYGGIDNFLAGMKEKWGFYMPYEDFMKERVEVFGRLTVAREGITDLLSYLKRKYKLGIITNGTSSMQREKLKYAKVEQYFDDILVSGEFTCDKPCVEIFLQSLKNLKVMPKEAVYIGDYYRNDVAPAMKAGITPIWLTTNRMAYPEYKGFCISSLSKLKELL